MKKTQRITLLFALTFSPLIVLSQEKTSSNNHVIKKTDKDFKIEKLEEGKNADVNFQKDYNKGREYYNKGVEMIKGVKNEGTLDERDIIQAKCIEQFKLALPYFEKAYKHSPKDKKTVEALTGIYSALNDQEKFNKFKKEFDLLNKK